MKTLQLLHHIVMLVEVKYRAFFAAFLTAQSEDHFGMGAGCYIPSLQNTVFVWRILPSSHLKPWIWMQLFKTKHSKNTYIYIDSISKENLALKNKVIVIMRAKLTKSRIVQFHVKVLAVLEKECVNRVSQSEAGNCSKSKRRIPTSHSPCSFFSLYNFWNNTSHSYFLHHENGTIKAGILR